MLAAGVLDSALELADLLAFVPCTMILRHLLSSLSQVFLLALLGSFFCGGRLRLALCNLLFSLRFEGERRLLDLKSCTLLGLLVTFDFLRFGGRHEPLMF